MNKNNKHERERLLSDLRGGILDAIIITGFIFLTMFLLACISNLVR